MLKRRMLACGILLWLTAGCSQEQQRVYIANDDHTDYYWSADARDYNRVFLEMLDYYLALADSTASERPEHQSRFVCDGSFWLWTYEQGRSRAGFERLIARIKDGHISVPLNPLPVVYGGVSAETIIRGMYYAGKIERQYNLRFPLVTGMEPATLPFGLVSLWAGAGATYCYHGTCNCATPLRKIPFTRDHEMYWWVGLDGRKLLTKWYSMPVSNMHLGGYAEAFQPDNIVEYVTTEADTNGFRRQYPYAVVGAFGYGWDSLATTTPAFVNTAKAKTNKDRLVVVSNIQDFFEDFEQEYGDDLPSQSLAFGNDWDLWQALVTELTSRVRRATERLRSAEALATLVSLHDPSFMQKYDPIRDRIWMHMGLFYEHNWCATGRVPADVRVQWLRSLAGEIEQYVVHLQADAGRALGSLIPQPPQTQQFYVFNPLSWPRTDYADVPIAPQGPFRVVELSTNAEVPHQMIAGSGRSVLRILARDIPPTGCRVYAVRPGAGVMQYPAAVVTNRILDHPLYRVQATEDGAIRSLVDKKNGNREIARSMWLKSKRGLNSLGNGTGTVTVENSGPVSVTLHCRTNAPVPHTTRITLFRDIDRIALDNEITQAFDVPQSWTFGFRLNKPEVWHEETGAVIRAALSTEGGQYSPVNARYDWLTLNHFADISEEGRYGVTLSNADCAFMQIGDGSSLLHLDSRTPTIEVLAGGDIQSSSTHPIHNQGGDAYFLQRFALQTHESFDPAHAMRFALEHQNPLVTGLATDNTGADASMAAPAQLLSLDNPNVLLWALKPSEEGITQGIIVRVWNLSDQAEHCILTLHGRTIQEAWETTHIETNTAALPASGNQVSFTLQRQQMQTYRLLTAPDGVD